MDRTGLELKELYPGSLKKNEEKRRTGVTTDDSAGSGAAGHRLATRIEFSNSMSPRQLGTVKSTVFKLATKCRGDAIGDEHIW